MWQKRAIKSIWAQNPLTVDAASFEVLSEGYARDKNHAFEILATKLKPIKGADPARFDALSATYARDGSNGFFRGKRIAKCDPTTLRPLHDVFAADATNFYFINKKMSGPVDGIDLHTATIRAQTNEVNRPPAILTDGKAVCVYTDKTKGWIAVQDVDPETVDFLGDPFNRGEYQVDARHVYYLGHVIEGAHPDTCRAFGRAMIRDDTRIWCGLHRLDGPLELDHDGKTIAACIDADLMHGGHSGDMYRDSAAVWQITPPRASTPFEKPKVTLAAFDAVTRLSADQALEVAYRRIFALLGSVFCQLPFCLDFQKLPEPLSDLPDLDIRRSGGNVEVLWQGARVAFGPISMWLSHASAFWGRVYGRRDRLYIYPNTNWLPCGDDLHCSVADDCAAVLIDLAVALDAAAQHEEAQVIAHLVLYRAVRRKVSTHVLAATPLTLVAQADHRDIRHDLESTTNLAAAREVMRLGLLKRDDFQQRYDALRLLHGLMNDTNKRAIFFAEIIPEVIRHQQDEPSGFLREMMAAIVEIALVAADVDIDVEVRGLAHYSAVEPFIRHQIAHGVNVDLNRARLIEALIALGRDAQAEHAALLDDCPDTMAAPPRYNNRIAWRNYRLKLLYGSILCATVSDASQVSHADLVGQVHAMRAYFGDPEDWQDFQLIERALLK